jgi:hypothetical protein
MTTYRKLVGQARALHVDSPKSKVLYVWRNLDGEVDDMRVGLARKLNTEPCQLSWEDAKTLVWQVIRDEELDSEQIGPVRTLAAKLRATVVLTARVERLLFVDPLVTTPYLVKSLHVEKRLRARVQGKELWNSRLGAFVVEHFDDGSPGAHVLCADQQGEVTHTGVVCEVRSPVVCDQLPRELVEASIGALSADEVAARIAGYRRVPR